MNTIHLFQEYVMYAALGGSLALLVGLIGYFMRNELRKFHLWVMNMPMLGKVIVFTGLAIGIVHGSTKTNLNTQAASPHAAGERFDLPSTPSAALQAANPNRSQVQPLPLAPERNRLAFVAGSEGDGATTNQADCLSACAAGTCVSNWTTRGAFLDWTRIEFPEGFSFPYGLERLSSVTLMSNGAIRTHLHNPAPIAQLPLPVSVEPNVSSVTHGLTASNSYLFAWHDACVNREATNRTDAAIELFADGSISVRMDSPLLPTPHSLLPPAIPEGFVGQGQDEDWIRGNFALLQEMDASLTNVTQILDVGYTNWLSGWVGIDAQNGRYQTAVTVPEVPAQPCYLVCGPFKVVVTAPGTYRFPFMVFTDFEIRTYPDALPLSIFYDDGYRGSLGQSWDFIPIEPSVTNGTHGTIKPNLLLAPETVPLSVAVGAHLDYWCNTPAWERTLRAIGRDIVLSFTATQAQIDMVHYEQVAEVELDWAEHVIYKQFTIEEINEAIFPTNRVDSAIAMGPPIQTTTNDWGVITYFTVSSESGSTNEVRQTTTVEIPAGHSCIVGAFMATMEQYDVRIPYCNDRIGWSVTAPGYSLFSGSATIASELNQIMDIDGIFKGEPGVIGYEHLLSSRRYTAPANQSLTLALEGWSQNESDGLRQTCVQLNVYPVDDNGNAVGWPGWAGTQD